MSKRKTTEEFLKEVEKVWGINPPFDTSLIEEYKNNRTKVPLRCLKCDSLFEKYPFALLGSTGGSAYPEGCPICSKKNRLKTNDEYIEELLKKHPNRDDIDFSHIKYRGALRKITLKCNSCNNKFQKIAGQLLRRGSSGLLNCPHCYKRTGPLGQTNISFEEFKRRSSKIHKNEYEYVFDDPSNFKIKSSKITFVHKTCGFTFETIAHLHCYNHSGCPQCARSPELSKEDFVKRSIEKFGEDYFDFSNSVFAGVLHPMEIYCKKCDLFFKLNRAYKHLKQKKGGCPSCSSNTKLNTETFVKRCEKKFGKEKFDFSSIKYTCKRKKVEIICKKHGPFNARPLDFLDSIHGCSQCAQENWNYKTEKLVRATLEDVFGISFLKTRRLPWLRNPNSKATLELDGYNEQHKIAFEFQGIQHYEPILFYGGEKGLIGRQKRDAIKRSACIANGICLIEIDGRKIPSSVRATKEKLKPYILEQLLDQPEWKKKRLIPLLENNHSL